MDKNLISSTIIGCAIEVHKQLGPGLLESTYQDCLLYELVAPGLEVEKELFLPLKYKQLDLDRGFRIDLLIERRVVVELKAVDKITDIHKAQLLTYLKLGNYKLGLLLNFNVKILKQGITIIINER